MIGYFIPLKVQALLMQEDLPEEVFLIAMAH